MPYQNVTISVNVADTGSGITEIILLYSVDNGITWNKVTVISATGDPETHIKIQASI